MIEHIEINNSTIKFENLTFTSGSFSRIDFFFKFDNYSDITITVIKKKIDKFFL